MNHAHRIFGSALAPPILPPTLAFQDLQIRKRALSLRDKILEGLRRLRPGAWDPGTMEVGFVPNEGETFMGAFVLGNTSTDRGTGTQLLLFTNVSPGETITEATLTEPTGTGYARITLTDGSWTEGAAGVYSYAEQTFTAGAGGWTGNIQGYAIVTTGTTPRILAIEVDAVNAPFTMSEGDTYKVTPQITFKDSTD